MAKTPKTDKIREMREAAFARRVHQMHTGKKPPKVSKVLRKGGRRRKGG